MKSAVSGENCFVFFFFISLLPGKRYAEVRKFQHVLQRGLRNGGGVFFYKPVGFVLVQMMQLNLKDQILVNGVEQADIPASFGLLQRQVVIAESFCSVIAKEGKAPQLCIERCENVGVCLSGTDSVFSVAGIAPGGIGISLKLRKIRFQKTVCGKVSSLHDFGQLFRLGEVSQLQRHVDEIDRQVGDFFRVEKRLVDVRQGLVSQTEVSQLV